MHEARIPCYADNKPGVQDLALHQPVVRMMLPARTYAADERISLHSQKHAIQPECALSWLCRRQTYFLLITFCKLSVTDPSLFDSASGASGYADSRNGGTKYA